MQLPQLLVVMPLLAVAVVSGLGCDDNGPTGLAFNGSTLPSRVEGRSVSRGVLVEPASIAVTRVGGAFCPTHPPFLAPFNVVFEGDGGSDLFLSSVQMQFVDTAEMRSGVSTLGRPELAVQFGSTTIPALGRRVFPFTFPFGCGVLPTGTLTVVVVAADLSGRERRTVRHIPVR